ncbi:MAG: Holliday junction resolvase RuvX [Proteobacteria bacterium]|jgi:putative Holliday junction resolvase|nr:Holliday junction resolvase RuvX [Alphaproteobacteria bacterium]NCC03657.1 Holliday junction resolvase RuvX [Pseudomonadota bacterium]
MTICNLSQIPSSLKAGQCLLGLDPGSVIVGVAIANPDATVASPLMGLKRGKFTKLAAQIAEIVRDRNVGGLVVGLPKNADGSEGPAAQSARTFVSNLLKSGLLPNPDLPVVFWDERFSTAAVTRFMIEDDMSRKRRAEKVDQAAAAYILQGALDALQQLKAQTGTDKG